MAVIEICCSSEHGIPLVQLIFLQKSLVRRVPPKLSPTHSITLGVRAKLVRTSSKFGLVLRVNVTRSRNLERERKA